MWIPPSSTFAQTTLMLAFFDRSDIPAVADHFVFSFAVKLGMTVDSIRSIDSSSCSHPSAILMLPNVPGD